MSDRFDRYIHGNQPPPQLTFEKELEALINKYSKENASGTPDWILADYLAGCLGIFNATIIKRAEWRSEPIELPALHNLRNGIREVPLVVYSGNLKMRNEIGTAKIQLTPGEELSPPFGQIEAVIAMFEELSDER